MGVLTAFPTLQRTFRASLSPEPPNEPRDKCQIDGTTSLGRTHLGENALLSFSFFLSFFESIWATHWAPSAVRAAKRTEAAEAELHAGRVDRWA